MGADHTYALLERITTLLRNEERAAGPEYLGLTKGTVSQTLLVLEILQTDPGGMRTSTKARAYGRPSFSAAFTRCRPSSPWKAESTSKQYPLGRGGGMPKSEALNSASDAPPSLSASSRWKSW